MTRHLPNKQSRQRLAADHANTLTEIARRAETPHGNSFGLKRNRQTIALSQWAQRRAIIVAEDFDLGGAGGVIGIYEARFLYWADDTSDDDSANSSSSSSSQHSSAQPPTGEWLTDETGDPVFVDGIDESEGFQVGDKIIIYFDDQRNMWVPIRGSAPVTESEPVAECCGAPVPCSQMVIDGFYSRRYQAKNVPARFGGVGADGIVILEFVGLRPTTNYYYWESDEFNIVCDDGTDIYFWRLEVHADGTAVCKSDGSETAKLYIVRQSPSSVCGDLTLANCERACFGELEEETSSGSS
jgi:hypothetical protein